MIRRMVKENFAVLLVLAAIYLSLCEPLVNGRMFAAPDFADQYIPMRIAYSLSLQRGVSGNWYPFLFRGCDLHAIGENGQSHPCRYLTCRFLPPLVAFLLEIIFLLPFSFAGMYLLLRTLSLNQEAKLFGAAHFSVSTFFFAHFGHIHMTWIIGHMPWAAFFAVCCLNSQRPLLAMTALASTVASMFLLGHPQMVWLVGLATGSFVVFHLRYRKSRRMPSGLCWIGGGTLLGLIIGMIQLLPTVSELVSNPRGHLSADMRDNFSLHPINLLYNFARELLKQKQSVIEFFRITDSSS